MLLQGEIALTPPDMKYLWTLHLRLGRVQTRGTPLDDVGETSQENTTWAVDPTSSGYANRWGRRVRMWIPFEGSAIAFTPAPDGVS